MMNPVNLKKIRMKVQLILTAKVMKVQTMT